MPNEPTFPSDQGPFLSAAFLCEKLLEEKDTVKSAIRIMDRIIWAPILPPGSSNQMQPFPFQPCLFLRFKSGMTRGSRSLQVTLFKPNGEGAGSPMSLPLYFEGEEDRGVDVAINMLLNIEMPGLYWIDIRLENQMVTRIPFRVIYSPQIMQGNR
ncbi:MAG TPA: hypothetical protein VN944_00110 [Nitrospiria bacterium]|nr:hypothetical protein [Nitrospiria bacterium]